MDGYSRIRGCLLGGAVGNALGAPIERESLAAIRARFGAEGLTDYAPAYGRLGAITADTQVTLFTVEGLIRAMNGGAARGLRGATVARFRPRVVRAAAGPRRGGSCAAERAGPTPRSALRQVEPRRRLHRRRRAGRAGERRTIHPRGDAARRAASGRRWRRAERRNDRPGGRPARARGLRADENDPRLSLIRDLRRHHNAKRVEVSRQPRRPT
ncbi:MAG: ADP-ribosylglycohydrolase family protein [Candidatus Polarisedimenticolia bacterium]|nr:ADP-ribosylglycohydrolase family protein [bacterium]